MICELTSNFFFKTLKTWNMNFVKGNKATTFAIFIIIKLVGKNRSESKVEGHIKKTFFSHRNIVYVTYNTFFTLA